MQEALGLAVVTDGEFRRLSYWNRFVEQVDGLEVGEARFSFTDESGDRLAFTAPHVTGKVGADRADLGSRGRVRALDHRSRHQGHLPSPSTMQFWFGPLSGAYESSCAFFARPRAGVPARRSPTSPSGAPTSCSSTRSRSRCCATRCARDVVAAEGEDPEQLVDDYVAAIAGALRGAPASVTTAMHVCRGNYKGHWMASGGYEPVAEKVFGRQRRRHALPRVRLRAVGRLRSAAPRSRRHDGRARVGQLEDTGARASRRPAPPDRRGVEGGARRAARAVAAMWLRVDGRRQPASPKTTRSASSRRIVEVCEEVWGTA